MSLPTHLFEDREQSRIAARRSVFSLVALPEQFGKGLQITVSVVNLKDRGLLLFVIGVGGFTRRGSQNTARALA